MARMARAPGLSVRLQAHPQLRRLPHGRGHLLLATVWVFLLRYVPDQPELRPRARRSPTRADLLDAFAPRAAQALAVLLVVGLAGGGAWPGGCSRR